jgi:purine-binding chemotaxis protein CheW
MPTPAASPIGQLLSFAVGDDEYGVDILQVKRLLEHAPATWVPGLPAWMRGVMSFHGAIIPVIDLRVRFGRPPGEYGRFSVIVVVSAGSRTIALLVDRVVGVSELAAGALQDAGDRAGMRPPFVQALAQVDDRVVTVLDVAALARPEGSMGRPGGKQP